LYSLAIMGPDLRDTNTKNQATESYNKTQILNFSNGDPLLVFALAQCKIPLKEHPFSLTNDKKH
jgi:hypothetical protein